MPRYQTSPANCASYPPPQRYEYTISENTTINIPPLPPLHRSPSRLHITPQNFLSPTRRRTLGSPSRQANPSLSPVKSHTNLRAAAAAGRYRTETYVDCSYEGGKVQWNDQVGCKEYISREGE